MSESTTRAYAHQTYSIDLAGLAAHARDTLRLHARPVVHRAVSSARLAIADMLAGLPDARSGPHSTVHGEHRVPDSVRIR